MFRFLAVASVLFLSVSTLAAADEADAAKKKNPDKRFQKIDANNDGKVTKEEIQKAFEGKVNKKGKPKGAKLINAFDRLDTNKDGSVTKEEFQKISELKKKK